MKNDSTIVAICSLLLLFTSSCSQADISTKPNQKLFPTKEACSYPANSSITKFHALSGETWRHFVVGGTDFGYDCGTSEKNVSLLSPGNQIDTAQIEYGVVGVVDGAVSLNLDYDISTTSQFSDELNLRKEFVVLLDEITKQALKEPIPESAKTKILDLKSYPNLGVQNVENIVIGEGRLTVSRNRNAKNTQILVKVSICADKNAKCE